MLFKRDTLKRIEAGQVTAAFRRWRRPSVKAGGTLKTAVGLLRIDSVEVIEPKSVTDARAVEAGHASALEVLELVAEGEGDLYHIRFQRAGPDPRIALRNDADLRHDELADLSRRLDRLDKASKTGPWTQAVLRLIEVNEAVRAADLAPQVDQERDAFKLNVRKLKNLGLTESLGTGYRISPRGQAILGRRDSR
jgi:hypothetical protein